MFLLAPDPWLLVLLPLAAAFVISIVLTAGVVKFAKPLGILDNPTVRYHPASLHTTPVPRGGGIPIFFAILISSLLFLTIEQRILGILLGAAIVAAIGFLDDRKDTNPYLRLLGQFLAAGIVVASGIGIAFISNPLGGVIDISHPRIGIELLGQAKTLWVLSATFGFIWIITLMNAVSWSSGVDGQLSGFAVIAALAIALLSLKFSADITQWSVTILAAATAGAFLGFLPWHVYPQKIMPGFSGATLAGFMLAVLSILSTTKVGTLALVLAIPLIDALYVITRRILRRKSIFKGDKIHLHHQLLEAGWSKNKIAIFYWTVSVALGIIALNLNTAAKLYTMIATVLFVGGLLLWLGLLLRSSKQPDRGNG